MGHRVHVLSPASFASLPCPTYPEFRVALPSQRQIGAIVDAFDPTIIHIASEETLAIAMRLFCLRRGNAFTTAYHSQIPEYVRTRVPCPPAVTYKLLQKFHAAATRILVPAPSLLHKLKHRGFKDLILCPPGVDTTVFHPQHPPLENLGPRPYWLFAGRLCIDKNLPAFLAMDLPGTKIVAGDGPSARALRVAYPSVKFVGSQSATALARYYAHSDVFVFPSLTDTFGLVMLEALACGLPVAAYPVPGPLDAVTDSSVGSLDFDLRRACERSLSLSRTKCEAYGKRHTWQKSALTFLENLVTIDDCALQPASATGPARSMFCDATTA